jgi:hypothetical protein
MLEGATVAAAIGTVDIMVVAVGAGVDLVSA